MTTRLLLCTLIVGGLILGGCATTPVSPGDQDGEPASGDPTTSEIDRREVESDESPTPERAAPYTDAATLALLQQSERAAASGAVGDALAYAERAVRLEPRRADLWTRLAALELRIGDAETAIQYANKALSLARDRVDWQRDAWLVIADARESQGDTDGARTIRARWQTYRG